MQILTVLWVLQQNLQTHLRRKGRRKHHLFTRAQEFKVHVFASTNLYMCTATKRPGVCMLWCNEEKQGEIWCESVKTNSMI